MLNRAASLNRVLYALTLVALCLIGASLGALRQDSYGFTTALLLWVLVGADIVWEAFGSRQPLRIALALASYAAIALAMVLPPPGSVIAGAVIGAALVATAPTTRQIWSRAVDGR